jgi:hypothetical protein
LARIIFHLLTTRHGYDESIFATEETRVYAVAAKLKMTQAEKAHGGIRPLGNGR